MIYYLRDSNSKLIGLKYNNNLYYYLKNVQDDIIGLLDNNYNLVAEYLYDSWGNIISIKDANGNEITDTSNIAHINPFRYRSYYYDSETKLYYLNSRYYNPIWGRFINADGIINADTWELGYNLYLYCKNNPIGYSDSNGKFGRWLTDFGKSVLNNAIDMIVPPHFSPYIKNNLVTEAGFGFGAGAGIGIGNLSLGFSHYQDITYKSKNDDISNKETTETVTGDFNLDFGTFGYSHSYIHEFPFDKSEFNSGNHNLNDTNTIFDCTESIHTYEFDTPVGTFSNDSYEFTLIDIDFHLIIGFHIKIGWEIDY